MVHLLTTSSSFQGRVLAARLGSEGIVTQLRGAVDGPYPFGEVLVYVDSDDLDLARQLLLADEVEDSFAHRPSPSTGRIIGLHHWAAGLAIAVAVASSVARAFSF
jgi:hypothetical protein